MQCPTDKTDLMMSERSGIEIDYCPQCRGVWLDRGELDKIIERSSSGPISSKTTDSYEQLRYQKSEPDRSSQGNNYDDRQYGKKRKKESFLGDLFDF